MKNTATTAVSNLLPLLKPLQWQEKLYLIQYLAAELLTPEALGLLPDQSYPVWTPLESYEAAGVLNHFLQTSTTR